MYILECCVDSVESAIAATNGGANRLELCGHLMIGGTTPSLSLYHQIKQACENTIHVLIRPRFGDFCYSKYEVNIMEEEIIAYRRAGADGVVIGALTPEGNLDQVVMERLIYAAGDMKITLHRAFDVCVDPKKNLETAILMGIDTILTSGQENSVLEGLSCLKRLEKQANNRIHIMAGSGVNDKVIKTLLEETTLRSFHMSGKVKLDSKMVYRKTHVHMGLDSISEYELWQTSEELVRKAKMLLV